MNKKQIQEAVKLAKTMGIYNPKSSLEITRNFAIIDNSLIVRNGSTVLVVKSTNIDIEEVEEGLYDTNGLKVNKSLEDFPSDVIFDKELVSVELNPEILSMFKDVTKLVKFPNPVYNALIHTYFDVSKNCIVATDSRCMIHKSNIDFNIDKCLTDNTDLYNRGFLVDIPSIPTSKVFNVDISIDKETTLFKFNRNDIEYSIYTKNNIFDNYSKYNRIMDDYLQDSSLKPNTTFTSQMLDYANKYHDKEKVVIFETKTIKSAFEDDLRIEVPCKFGINNDRLQLLTKHVSKEAYVENDIKPIVFRFNYITAIVQPIAVKED